MSSVNIYEQSVMGNNELRSEQCLMVSQRLNSRIKEEIKRLPISLESSCISQVPDGLRRGYEEAFTPRLISIGPLHRGKPELQLMEAYKWRCLDSYIVRCGVDPLGLIRRLVQWIINREELYRSYYSPVIDTSFEEFTEMMLLDGAFLVELWIRSGSTGEISTMFATQWIEEDLKHDIMLIENQLPFSLISFLLLHLFNPSIGYYEYDILTGYFQQDLISFTERIYVDRCTNLVSFLRYWMTGDNANTNPCNGKYVNVGCATQLLEAGVKFKLIDNAKSVLDITFSNGELCMPPLLVNEHSETLFRNMIAYELCSHKTELIISSYMRLVDSLLDTAKDVDLLVEKGIIKNHLDNSEKVLELFNRLYKVKAAKYKNDNHFYFENICRDLNMYSRNIWHQWRATMFKWKIILLRDYFSNPWSVISVIGAIMLLLLTITQTVCSILSL